MKRHIIILAAAVIAVCLAACGNDPTNTYEYIDMGAAGQWAAMNVGANKASDPGKYFAWGEVESKSQYDWATYTHCDGDDWLKMTKYVINDHSTGASWYDGTTFKGDGKTILESGDDAATQLWGKKWRTPTRKDWEALMNKENYTWKWTNKDGTPGVEVTSLKGNTAGNTIFLPATGSYTNNTVSFQTSSGFYWSAEVGVAGGTGSYTFEDATAQAWAIYISQDAQSLLQLPRSNGVPVRAIRK